MIKAVPKVVPKVITIGVILKVVHKMVQKLYLKFTLSLYLLQQRGYYDSVHIKIRPIYGSCARMARKFVKSSKFLSVAI